MKRIGLLVFVVLLAANVASAEGLKYVTGSWSEIRAKAKAEQKYIFIDCYTEWCGWCKVMDKKTMVLPEVYNTLNEQFIPVKLDMEKGEGKLLAMKYHISAFPSFMFFNPDGEYVYLVEGYREAADFQEDLRNARARSEQFYAPGYDSPLKVPFPDFYAQGFAGNGERKFPDSATSNGFLAKQKDLYSEVCWGIISRFEVNEKFTGFFLDNAQKYEQLYGGKGVRDKIERIVYSKVRTAIKDKSRAAFDDALAMADKYISGDVIPLKLNFKIQFFKEMKQWDEFGSALDEVIGIPDFNNPAFINAQCWDIYENCDDKKVVKQACGYMAEVVKEDPSYACLDTYAALLYKSGSYKDAEVWAEKAIAAGKESGDKTDATKELLEKIKAVK